MSSDCLHDTSSSSNVSTDSVRAILWDRFIPDGECVGSDCPSDSSFCDSPCGIVCHCPSDCPKVLTFARADPRKGKTFIEKIRAVTYETLYGDYDFYDEKYEDFPNPGLREGELGPIDCDIARYDLEIQNKKKEKIQLKIDMESIQFDIG